MANILSISVEIIGSISVATGSCKAGLMYLYLVVRVRPPNSEPRYLLSPALRLFENYILRVFISKFLAGKWEHIKNQQEITWPVQV